VIRQSGPTSTCDCPSGPTTKRASPWPLLCSLVFEVPPFVSQPLSSLSLAFHRDLCLSVCFVCESQHHGTNTTFRGRRVDPEFEPLHSRAWGRRVFCCRLLSVLRCGVAGRCLCGRGGGDHSLGARACSLAPFLVPPSFLFFHPYICAGFHCILLPGLTRGLRDRRLLRLCSLGRPPGGGRWGDRSGTRQRIRLCE